jgi:hypothetical protein
VTNDQNMRHRHGVPADLLESFNDLNGKILNALDFLQHTADHPPLSVASDLVAFQAMACRGSKDEYPTSNMCWGIAATQGVFYFSY